MKPFRPSWKAAKEIKRYLKRLQLNSRKLGLITAESNAETK